MADRESGGQTQAVLPQLRYDRPIEAIEWLARVFGFVEESRMSGPNGEVYIAVLRAPGDGSVLIAGPMRDDLEAFVRSRIPSRREGVVGWPNFSYSITVMVPDVDAHHDRAVAAGAHILTSPHDQPWGLRDYEAFDLEGRWWNFSQHLRTVDPQDWGASRAE